MQEIDQRDRELLGALQGEIPLVSTPYAFVGQIARHVRKRSHQTHRAAQARRRDQAARGALRLARARLSILSRRRARRPERIDEAAAVINAHPGVTQNYRRNNDFNLWFTLFVSPQSKLGLEKTIDILGRQRGLRRRPPAADAEALQEQRLGRRDASPKRRARRLHAAHAAGNRVRSPAAARSAAAAAALRRLSRASPASARTSCCPPRARCRSADRSAASARRSRRANRDSSPRDGRLDRAAGSAPTSSGAKFVAAPRRVALLPPARLRRLAVQPLHDRARALGRRMRVDHQRPRHRHRHQQKQALFPTQGVQESARAASSRATPRSGKTRTPRARREAAAS